MGSLPLWLLVLLVLLSSLAILHSFLLIGLVQIAHRGGVADEGKAAGLGRPVPHLVVQALDGRSIDTATLVGSRWAFLFISTDCKSCSVTVDELAALSNKVQERVVVVCRGDEETCRGLAGRHSFPVVADPEGEIRSAFGVTSVPTAVLVDEQGRIESEGHPERRDLEALAGDVKDGAVPEASDA